MVYVFIQPLLSGKGNLNLFTPVLLLFKRNKLLILQKIERWIDHARAGGVVALGQGLDRLNQLVTVAGVAGQDIEDHQP